MPIVRNASYNLKRMVFLKEQSQAAYYSEDGNLNNSFELEALFHAGFQPLCVVLITDFCVRKTARQPTESRCNQPQSPTPVE